MLRNIELLRFIFTFIIVSSHLPILLNLFPQYMPLSSRLYDGVLGVDFFFILSGFFFAYTNKTQQTFSDFVVRKIKRLWPVMAFTLAFFFLFFYWGLPSFGQDKSDYIYPLLFLNNLGLTFVHMGVYWYVAVLFVVLVFYFMLFKIMKPMTALLTTGLLSFFGYVFVVNETHGEIYRILEMAGPLFNIGLLRGVAGIGLGILLCAAYQNYQPVIKRLRPSFVYTLLEIGVLGGCIYSLTIQPPALQNHFIFIIAFVALIGLFLIKKGKISQWADCSLSQRMGCYCYSIFLSHLLVFYFLSCSVWMIGNRFIAEHLVLSLFFVYECVLLLGVLIYHVIERPQNRFVARYGYKAYWIGVLMLSAFLFSVSVWMLQQKPMQSGAVYFFNQPQIAVPVQGIDIRNWKGGFSESGKVRIQFQKEKGQLLKARFVMAPLDVENQEVFVFINQKPTMRWIFKEKNKLQTIDLGLPKTEKVDILFRFKEEKEPMLLLKMQVLPAVAE